MDKTTLTNSTTIINPTSFEEAIKLLEDSEKERQVLKDRLPTMIATLAAMDGKTVYINKLLPRDTIIIGDGPLITEFEAPRVS